MADATEGPQEGEVTRRTRIRVHTEREAMARRATQWKVLAGLVAVGFGAATYLYVNFARASVVTKQSERIDLTDQKIERNKDQVDHLTTDVALVKQSVARLEEDSHWMRDQIVEVARTVRAAPIPPPKHSKETAP